MQAFWWCCLVFVFSLRCDEVVEARWSAERAREWGVGSPSRLGANYLPSHCGNVLDFFHELAFENTLLAMERELQVAESVGFSTLRLFLHEEIFHHQGETFLDNLSRVLDVMHRHGMSAVFVLFDACWRPDVENANALKDVHNSAWVQCPSHRILSEYALGNAEIFERLRKYVISVVGRFGRDPRVAVWDIYNEPSMRDSEHWILPRLAIESGWSGYPKHWLLDGKKFEAVFSLLQDAFRWVRSLDPMQPLTTALWQFPSSSDDALAAKWKAALNSKLLELSDVISLHCYCSPTILEERLRQLTALGRGPVLVTEFLARPMNSTLQESLPLLSSFGSWGYTWGLFNGASQTHLAWESWVQDDMPADVEWFHDVFYKNGTAYRSDEARAMWWHAKGSHLRI